MSQRAPADRRAAYPYFARITTRWMDNDAYAHVNNVVYYSFFDTAVNQLLIEGGVLDIRRSPIVGFVVETQCRFFTPLAFPDRVAAGVRVARIGTSSVRYEVGIFRDDDETAAAQGHFVHVYVDRAGNRPVSALPEALQAVLQPLLLLVGG
jgi:acyl-CoA thioester hydrolase